VLLLLLLLLLVLLLMLLVLLLVLLVLLMVLLVLLLLLLLLHCCCNPFSTDIISCVSNSSDAERCQSPPPKPSGRPYSSCVTTTATGS
jgi:hypothetical protein